MVRHFVSCCRFYLESVETVVYELSSVECLCAGASGSSSWETGERLCITSGAGKRECNVSLLRKSRVCFRRSLCKTRGDVYGRGCMAVVSHTVRYSKRKVQYFCKGICKTGCVSLQSRALDVTVKTNPFRCLTFTVPPKTCAIHNWELDWINPKSTSAIF